MSFKNDFINILEKLGEERSIFHSEKDFQHALACKIHELYLQFKIRLEKKFSI
ncbi:MAG: hypothetical protein ACTSRP_00020 [Candidatus Helarchaeota archaeon]